MNRKVVPFLILGSGLALTAALAPMILESAQSHQARVGRATGLQRGLAQSQLEDQVTSEAAELARSRFEAGCLLIVDLETSTYVAITEGSRVVDRLNRRALPPNVRVCDYLGGTGITDQNGVITNYAFLGDAVAVREFTAHANENRMLAGVDFTPEPAQFLGGQQ